MSDADIAELQELVEEHDIGLLTTRSSDGHLHARPMALRSGPLSEGLWFATTAESAKVADLENDPRCGVAFHKASHDASYLSISGTAELIRDPQTIRRMWSPAWKARLPGGPDRGDIVLICLRPEHAEFVHPHTGKLHVLAAIAKRIAHVQEGTSPKVEVDFAPPSPS